MASNPTPPGGNFSLAPPGAAVVHTAPDEHVDMNKYHVLWVLERLQRRHQGPSLDQVAIPLTFCVGLLVAIIPNDFAPFMGLERSVWQAIVIILFGLSAVATLVLFGWWLRWRPRNAQRAPEQILDEILDQMARDRERLKGQ